MKWRRRHTVLALGWAIATLAGQDLPASTSGLVGSVVVTFAGAFVLTYFFGVVWQRSARWYRERRE